MRSSRISWLKAIGITVTTFGVAAISTSVHAQSWRTLNLNPKADARNWEGILVTRGTLQSVHKFVGGQLVVGAHGSGTRSSSGSTAAGTVATLDRSIYEDLRSIEVTAKVDSARFRGCSSSSNTAVAYIGATASWFNNGTGAGGRDGTGNLQSRIQLTVGEGDTRATVRGTLYRCEDFDCNQVTFIEPGWVSLGRVNFGSEAVMKMTHNRTTNTVVLSSKIGTRTRTQRYALSGIDSPVAPPSDEPTSIQTRAWTPNCASGARPFSNIQGKIRKIRARTY